MVAMILWEGNVPSGYTNVYSWDEFMEYGDDTSVEGELQVRIKNQRPGHCCSIIYTSGKL